MRASARTSRPREPRRRRSRPGRADRGSLGRVYMVRPRGCAAPDFSRAAGRRGGDELVVVGFSRVVLAVARGRSGLNASGSDGLNSHTVSVLAATPTPGSSLRSAARCARAPSRVWNPHPRTPPPARWRRRGGRLVAPRYCVAAASIWNGGTSAMSRRLQNDRASVLLGDTRRAGAREQPRRRRARRCEAPGRGALIRVAVSERSMKSRSRA